MKYNSHNNSKIAPSKIHLRTFLFIPTNINPNPFKNIINGEKTVQHMCEDCYDEHYEESEEYKQEEDD